MFKRLNNAAMINSFPVLKTSRLLLRPFEDSDLENVFKGLSHPDVIKYYGVSYTSLEETKNQMKFYKELEVTNTGKWWAICSPGNDTFYGGCGLNHMSAQHFKAEIGYWLLPQFWGIGIISEALPLIIQYGFTIFSLHRIEAVVESNNIQSKKVMERAGFQHEGTLRECEFKNGKFIDLDMYAKLNSFS